MEVEGLMEDVLIGDKPNLFSIQDEFAISVFFGVDSLDTHNGSSACSDVLCGGGASVGLFMGSNLVSHIKY